MSAAGANAATINPYLSEKISFTWVNVSEPEMAFNQTDVNKGTKENDNAFGNRLAAGIEFPIDSIYGAVRAELEWGVNTNAKVKSNLKEVNGVAVSGSAIGTAIELKSHTFGLNAYYDFDIGSGFKPYVGAGVGFAHVKSNSAAYGMPANYAISGESSTNTFIWNVGGGVSYDLTDALALDIAYRYSDFGKVSGDLLYNENGLNSTIVGKSKISSHEVLLGVRYSF
jgi:opacity protein-like surface antigen